MEQEKNIQFSTEDIKKIIADITEEERINSGFKGEIKTLTTVEYYKESFKNKNFSLVKKIKSFTLPLTSRGFYNSKSSSIVVFLDSYNKIIDPNKKLLLLIKTCYHEIRHSTQNHLDSFSFDKFAYDIDRFIACNDSVYYDKNHDFFFFEIDANIYSIKKAKEYLEKNFPSIYKKESIKKEIEEYDDIYFTDWVFYDIGNSIERAISLLKNQKSSKKAKDFFSPILNIFLNTDNSFKSIIEIVNNENFKNIDNRIICALFSSKSFLESIDFNNLSYYELEILNKSLKYTIELFTKQQRILDMEQQPYKERLEFYLKIEKNIIRKLSHLHTCKILIKTLSERQLKPSKKYKLYKKKLPEYLDKTKSLLSNIK